MKNIPILYLVIPCYNESEIIKESLNAINAKLGELVYNGAISPLSRAVFVNDGSRDNTLELLKEHKSKANIIVSLSTNKGHQNALWAGLEYASNKCDCVISLDCDLQDDINLIDRFIEKFNEGFEVVYGVRNNREQDSFLKRKSAESFYSLMKFLGANIISNHADYRLLSQKTLQYLLDFKEVNLFLRGLVPLVGFKSCNLYYKRDVRIGGVSKYPFFKMLSFALEGITSFSVRPLRLLSVVGGVICVISIAIGLWALAKYFMGETISGWTSMVVPMYLLGGIQMLGLGILGEYIGKIYSEVKNRPKYFISEIVE